MATLASALGLDDMDKLADGEWKKDVQCGVSRGTRRVPALPGKPKGYGPCSASQFNLCSRSHRQLGGYHRVRRRRHPIPFVSTDF